MDFLTNMPHYAKHPSSSKAWLVSRLTTKLRKQKLRKPRHVPPAKTWELESPSNRCWCSPIPLPHSPLHGYRYRLPSTDSDRRDPPLRNTWVFLVIWSWSPRLLKGNKNHWDCRYSYIFLKKIITR